MNQNTEGMPNRTNKPESTNLGTGYEYGLEKVAAGYDDKAIKLRNKKKPWTREEDQKLISLVSSEGKSSWVTIAKHLPHRTGKQCRERWYNKLDPSIKIGLWTEEEDQLIVKLHDKYGNKWAKMAKELDGRPSNMIKNRWHSHLSKRKIDEISNQDPENQSPERSKKRPLTDTHIPAQDIAPLLLPFPHSPVPLTVKIDQEKISEDIGEIEREDDPSLKDNEPLFERKDLYPFTYTKTISSSPYCKPTLPKTPGPGPLSLPSTSSSNQPLTQQSSSILPTATGTLVDTNPTSTLLSIPNLSSTPPRTSPLPTGPGISNTKSPSQVPPMSPLVSTPTTPRTSVSMFSHTFTPPPFYYSSPLTSPDHSTKTTPQTPTQHPLSQDQGSTTPLGPGMWEGGIPLTSTPPLKPTPSLLGFRGKSNLLEKFNSRIKISTKPKGQVKPLPSTQCSIFMLGKFMNTPPPKKTVFEDPKVNPLGSDDSEDETGNEEEDRDDDWLEYSGKNRVPSKNSKMDEDEPRLLEINSEALLSSTPPKYSNNNKPTSNIQDIPPLPTLEQLGQHFGTLKDSPSKVRSSTPFSEGSSIPLCKCPPDVNSPTYTPKTPTSPQNPQNTPCPLHTPHTPSTTYDLSPPCDFSLSVVSSGSSLSSGSSPSEATTGVHTFRTRQHLECDEELFKDDSEMLFFADPTPIFDPNWSLWEELSGSL